MPWSSRIESERNRRLVIGLIMLGLLGIATAWAAGVAAQRQRELARPPEVFMLQFETEDGRPGRGVAAPRDSESR